jgi:hypothetical protein
MRSFISDGSIVKVVHCCYGDAASLRIEHGIMLDGAFDTGVTDSVLRGASPNANRGLGTVLREWLSEAVVHLTHKGKLVHVPFMFNVRPLSLEHFVYSAEDVEYCIELFKVMRTALVRLGLLELVVTLSNDRCTPTRHVADPAAQLVIAIVDACFLLCMEDRRSGELSLPSAPFDPNQLGTLAQRELKALLGSAWSACMGVPPPAHRFSTTVNAQLRIPKRVGSMYVSYGVLPTWNRPFVTGLCRHLTRFASSRGLNSLNRQRK